ncbi:MAG: hypothetical protein EPN85_06365 [Bacteroidetes bacterium]|nr:MAG: hypothetical protein EPN85_06365 [Bacteroidota bacterium]
MEKFSENYPNLNWWVENQGWIEIGQDENSRSMVRILDEGGMVWESDPKSKTLDKDLNEAERFIAKWIEENT